MQQCDNGEFLKVFSDTAKFQGNSGGFRRRQGLSGPESRAPERLHINLKMQTVHEGTELVRNL